MSIKTSEHLQNSLTATKFGWITLRSGEQKVISKNIITLFDDIIINGDLFCVLVVGDADIESICAKILDRISGITFIPGNSKWGPFFIFLLCL
jgi:hypothetical protein